MLAFSKKLFGTWNVYKIEVPDNELVELCTDGLYYNLAKGIVGTATEIKYLEDAVPLDSEVVIISDNAKCVGLDCKLLVRECDYEQEGKLYDVQLIES